MSQHAVDDRLWVSDGWIPDETTFGARLALVRQVQGWNVREAARECGLSPSAWREWENGRQPRDPYMACRAIAGRAGVSEYWLLTAGRPPHVLAAVEHEAGDPLCAIRDSNPEPAD